MLDSDTLMTLLNPSENAVELLLFNSAMIELLRLAISAGIYRFVCANGLVIADSVFESYKIKHIGERDNDVVTAIERITNIKPLLEQKIHSFEAIKLQTAEKQAFAKASIPLRFEDHLDVDLNELLDSS